jgi:Domain of unknown function (DUF932)
VDRVVLGVVVVLTAGLGGPWRVPAARGWAVALRVEPLSKAQRLDPDGRTSLARIQPGRQWRLKHAAALSHARGARAAARAATTTTALPPYATAAASRPHRPPTPASPAPRASRRTPTPEPSPGGREADEPRPPFEPYSTIEGNHHVLDHALATRFARNTRVMRGDQPLSEDQMRAAALSIFAEGKHASRSERYTNIPTIDVLRGLRKEGFEPFMLAQGASCIEGSSAYTNHLIRTRHAGQVQTRPEANEIILINSLDGASLYVRCLGKAHIALRKLVDQMVAHARTLLDTTIISYSDGGAHFRRVSIPRMR